MRTSVWILGLLALMACEDKESDVDGDGVDSPADCNDNDPAVKPGAPELCDEVDNDCDGQTDEGLGEEYFADNDGDGYGVASERFVACVQPDFATQTVGDCDDTDSEINPDAEEDCSPVDRNCDNDPTSGATDLTTGFIDRDGDGYGDINAQAITACTLAEGFVANADDCDDANDEVSPDAVEVCNTIDDNCDAQVDNDATDAVFLFVDADRDTYGDPTSGALACPAFGFVTDDTDCDDTNNDVFPGAAEECNGGIDDDCDPSTDEDELDGRTY
jgi:hypothetical protein